MKAARSFLLGAFALVGALGVAMMLAGRLLALWIFALATPVPELVNAPEEPASVQWFDDYFTIQTIDAETHAIGEPRYWQANYGYLILGQERAILFDSGPGVRDIRPVVASLTDLPVTVVASHLHYDHVGNHARFDRIAQIDLPHLRERAASGDFRPSAAEHLGFFEGFDAPTLESVEWWAPGATIELGERRIQVLSTPGHTPESTMLFDRERGMLFTGDFLYPGPLIAFVPGSDLGEYLATARRLAEDIPPNVRLFTAHRDAPPGAPILAHSDLVELRDTLAAIRDGRARGSGFPLETFPVNEKIWIEVESAWLNPGR